MIDFATESYSPGLDDGDYGLALSKPKDSGTACTLYAVGKESRIEVARSLGARIWID